MKVLAICRPAAGVNAAVEFGKHLDAELEALRSLSERGLLAEAYSPGVPGAVLVFSVPELSVAEECARSLPLAQAQLIDVELLALHVIPL